MPKPREHLAELLLNMRFHGATDTLRSRRPFSPDIEAVHAVLFSPRYDRQAKIRTYRSWFEKNQPCVFGKTAATNKNIYICLLEDHEILRMQRGDPDVMDTLQDHRQVWKRLALEGSTSSFVIRHSPDKPTSDHARAERGIERDLPPVDGALHADKRGRRYLSYRT